MSYGPLITKLDFNSSFGLEIGSLNGYVCQVARQQGIECRENDKPVADALEAVENRDAANLRGATI